ncbi:MAG: hypothetical protein EBS01_16670, partial [Verrucomicrobia bacterium]|nr:hypothetical protein [Verrucomicrobiota bacterium]
MLTKVKNGQISSMITKRGGKGAIDVGIPAAIGAEVPEALRAVTLKAMAKERAKRYASVEEFAADLEAYQNGFATRAEDAGAFRKLVLFVKRNKAVSALVSAMLLGAVLFTVRLAASEKVAVANAQRAAASAEEASRNEQKAQASAREAKQNEQKAEASAREAIAQRETARAAAAKAQIALAEAAERDLNGEDMEKALLQVPEDLRNQNWEYLHKKLHSESLIVDADPKTPWSQLLPNPAQPGKLVAVMTGQRIGEIDLETGNFTEWFNKKGKPVGEAALFLDAKRIVLYVNEGYGAKKRIEILSLPDGATLAQWELPNNFVVKQMMFSPDQKLLFVQIMFE